jgi:hypothetical protein
MRKFFEVFLLNIAYKIIDRNLERSMVISRKDNNYLFEVASKLKQIIYRIKTEYNEI